MAPISRLVDSSQAFSDSDPQMSVPSGSLLITWRIITAGGGGMGSWNNANQSNQSLILPGGVFVSWLVSVSSEKIMGFIVQGFCFCVCFFPHVYLYL